MLQEGISPSVNQGVAFEEEGFFVHKCTLKNTSFDEVFRNRSKWLRLTSISESNLKTKKYFSSMFTIEQEMKRHINGPNWYIIHPLSNFTLVWEQFMLVVHIVNWYVVLFQIANYGHLTSTSELINFAIQCPCYVDIVLRFFMGYRTSYEINLDQSKIVKHYLKTYFFFDLIASIPFQFVERPLANRLSRLSLNILVLYQALKVCTFLRIQKYFYHAFSIWDHYFVSYMISTIILSSLLMYHFVAFVYQVGANFDQVLYPTTNTHPLNTIQNVAHFPNLDQFWYRNFYCIYLAGIKLYCYTFVYESFYDDKPVLDCIFAVIIILLAYTYHLCLLVMVIRIFQYQHSSKIRYLEIMNQLERYMRTKRLPLLIKKSLIEYYQQRYQYRFFKEKSIQDNLSETLRSELTFHCGQLFISRISIFNNVPGSVLNNIVASLKPEIYMPNDLITKAGTPGDCMYFIASGTVSIRAKTGQELLHLEDGDYFGEVSLFSKQGKRVTNSIAIEYCELYRLDKTDYEANIAIIPELADRFEALAMQRMNATITIEETFKAKPENDNKREETDDDDSTNLSSSPTSSTHSDNFNV